MSIEYITDNIVRITFESKHDTAFALMRMQEFYESPFMDIRKKYFSQEYYIDRYVREYGKFDYWLTCVGFNIPGKHIKLFYELFEDDTMSDKEKKVKEHLTPIIEEFNENFYLIAACDDTTLAHETAHAIYNLDNVYRRTVNSIIQRIPQRVKQLMLDTLIGEGYTGAVLKDEINAYCATSSMAFLTNYFGTKDLPWGTILEFQELFEHTKANVVN